MSAWSDAVAATSPYLWWKLDETSGSTAADASGNGRSGSYSSATLGQPSLIDGEPSGFSVSLPTASAVVQRTSGLAIPTVGATFAVTFRSSGAPGGQMFRTDNSTYLSVSSSDVTAIFDIGSSVSMGHNPSAWFDGAAHLIVYVVRAATVELWVDGVKVADVAHSAPTLTRTLFAPKRQFSEPVGTYDDAVVWTTALSASQIGALYDGWSAAPPADPSLTLVGVQPRDVGAITFQIPVAVALAGAERRDEGVFAVDVPPAIVLAGEQRREVGAFDLEPGPVVLTTDTSNRLGGLSLGGYGVASWSPAVVPPPVGGGHAVVSAQAFGSVTMQGAQPVYAISEASVTRDRHRILVGGVDVTYFRDTPTPAPSYQLGEPLLWGPATLEFPQIAATKERFGRGELSWLTEQAPVVVQRVDVDGNVTAVDYRGFVLGFDTSGADLRVECGGHAHGRAALQNRQVPIFQFVRDIGWYAYWAVKGALNRAFEPALGPTTGIELGRLAGGQTQLDYIRELCAQAQTKSGKRWTIMPDDRGVYSMTEKDVTTIHATVFDDDARIVAALRDDLAEKPNRIYVTGVTPAGQRVRFGAYPGLIHGKAPDYPFNDNRTFGAGTTDADTDTGDGVTVLAARLRHTGFLSADDSPGGYDDDVTRGVKALQRRAGLDVTGDVNVNTWEAAFDLNVTGYSITGSQVEPAAQGRATKKWLRSASGAIIGRNPYYKPGRVAVDRNIDLGSSGFKRGLMRDFAQEELQEARTSNWHGTVTITTGAVLAGEVAEGAAITAADVMDARDLRPGMNLWLPQFDGGTLVHISGMDVDGDGNVQLTVDSRARDALEVWEVIDRNRETRNNPARSWASYRSSQETKDSIGIWDEVGGLLSGNVDLEPGWNVLPIVAGQAGTIAKLRLELKDAAEFACAVFGAKTGAGRLNHLISDPLTKAGTEAWEKRHIRKVLDDHILLYSAGTNDEPCGYSPGRKQNDEGNRSGHPLRGVHRDEASFSYLTAPGRPVLYLAVYVRSANVLKRGRVMWPQLEAAV